MCFLLNMGIFHWYVSLSEGTSFLSRMFIHLLDALDASIFNMTFLFETLAETSSRTHRTRICSKDSLKPTEPFRKTKTAYSTFQWFFLNIPYIQELKSRFGTVPTYWFIDINQPFTNLPFGIGKSHPTLDLKVCNHPGRMMLRSSPKSSSLKCNHRSVPIFSWLNSLLPIQPRRPPTYGASQKIGSHLRGSMYGIYLP